MERTIMRGQYTVDIDTDHYFNKQESRTGGCLMVHKKCEVGLYLSKINDQQWECKTGIFCSPPFELIAFGMNGCSYDYSLEIIEQLNKVLKGEIGEYEWGGGERAWFVSEKESTKVEDHFGWSESFHVATKELLACLMNRNHLYKNYSKEEMQATISVAFERVKKDKEKFRSDKNEFLYKIEDEEKGIVIVMILSEEDFNSNLGAMMIIQLKT